MAHAVKSPLFNALEMAIEEQFGRDFDCPHGAGALRKADGRTACRVQQTGQPLTGTGGEHWCISCHSPSENIENLLPAWDGRPGGDPKTRRPPRDLLGERAMEGISCGFCHQVHGPVGARGSRGYQGNPTWTSPFTGATFAARPEDGRGLFGIANSGYDLRPEELLLAAGARPTPAGGASAGGIDPIVHARPSRSAQSYLASSEFCGSCHDVRLFGTDVLGVAKGEHFKRLRNAYTEWTEWAKIEQRAGRPASSCQDCHMSTFPGVCEPAPDVVPAADTGSAKPGKWAGICPPGTRFAARKPGSFPKALSAASSPGAEDAVTHYFSGVDVPLSREYPEALVDEGSLDVHGIPLSAKKRRDLLLRATFRFELDRPRRSGGALEIPVVVENVGAGHKVPAGFSQEREIWVHLTVRDASGAAVYEVGRVSRGDEDLRDKVFERVNVSDALTDGKGRPLGMFGADVRDGPDVPLWDPPPALGGTRFRGRGLVNFQNGFLRCVRCIGEIAADGSCKALPGQERLRADRFDDGDYDLDTGECRSNLSGENALFETYFPVGALDASRGVLKGPDAIIDTRSLPPGVPITVHVRARRGRPRRSVPRRGAAPLPRVPAVPRERLHRLRARASPQGPQAERAARHGRHAEAARDRGGGPRDGGDPVTEPTVARGARSPKQVERWPAIVEGAAVLRGLDDRARREIAEAGALLHLEAGEAVYRAGDSGDSFYVVAEGHVALRAVKRGDDVESDLRTAEPGASFGEESTIGSARRATAIATTRAVVAEIPVHVFRRAAGRAGKAEMAERIERALSRTATRDLLRTLALTRDLPEASIDALLDAVAHRSAARGEILHEQGSAAGEVWLLADGLVQIQTEEDGRLHVRAYLSRGDFFGDVEVLEGTRAAPPPSRAAPRGSFRSRQRRSAPSPSATPNCPLLCAASKAPRTNASAPSSAAPPTRRNTSSATSTGSRSPARSSSSICPRACAAVTARGRVRTSTASRASCGAATRSSPACATRPTPRRACSSPTPASTARTPRASWTARPARSAAIPRARSSSATPSAPGAARVRRRARGTTSRWPRAPKERRDHRVSPANTPTSPSSVTSAATTSLPRVSPRARRPPSSA